MNFQICQRITLMNYACFSCHTFCTFNIDQTICNGRASKGMSERLGEQVSMCACKYVRACVICNKFMIHAFVRIKQMKYKKMFGLHQFDAFVTKLLYGRRLHNKLNYLFMMKITSKQAKSFNKFSESPINDINIIS